PSIVLAGKTNRRRKFGPFPQGMLPIETEQLMQTGGIVSRSRCQGSTGLFELSLSTAPPRTEQRQSRNAYPRHTIPHHAATIKAFLASYKPCAASQMLASVRRNREAHILDVRVLDVLEDRRATLCGEYSPGFGTGAAVIQKRMSGLARDVSEDGLWRVTPGR